MTPISTAHQTAQDCYWSRPGHRLSGVSDSEQPESVWVCVREGHRQNVAEEDCATCAYWQRDVTAGSAPAAVPLTASSGAPAGRLTIGRALFTGAVVVALGSVFAIVGAPVPIGFTVTGWLFAGAIVAVSRYGQSSEAR